MKEPQIMRRALTHEQVWIVRDEHERGVLNMAKRAREFNTSPPTIRARFKVDEQWYPRFTTIGDARRRDSLQKYCIGFDD